jgi:transketolase
MRQTCLNTVFDLAKKNKKVIFIGSDLGPGVLDSFKKKYPNRFFMEGVAEQSIIGLAAGLAFEKFRPYVNTIATFITRRCYEQVLVDLCLHNLPVTLIGNGGGLVYAPLGPTHQAIEDISIMRALPNLTIISPSDAYEMKKLMLESINLKGPLYVRIARGGEKIINDKRDKIKIGKGLIKRKPGKLLFVSTGVMTQKAIDASEELKKKYDINSGVLHLGTIKPLDEKILKYWIPKVEKIITVEENILEGGFGSSILEFVNFHFKNLKIEIQRVGLPNKFVNKYGSQDDLHKYYKLDKKNLVTIAKKMIIKDLK